MQYAPMWVGVRSLPKPERILPNLQNDVVNIRSITPVLAGVNLLQLITLIRELLQTHL
jgi:hypothetical protein